MDPGKQFTDEHLIQLIINGGIHEESAIRELYAQYLDPLCRQVIFKGGSAADGQDMFQETVIAFVHTVKQGRFRGEASIKTFLYAMNNNIWKNAVRGRDRAEQRDRNYDAMVSKEEKAEGGMIERKELSHQLKMMLEGLGENCRKILMQFYYENRSMKEIVQTLDYENEQVVRNKKSKCLKKLSEMLGQRPHLVEQLKTFLNE